MNTGAEHESLREQIGQLLSSQHLAVLATHNNGQPHASLVAFAAAPELDRLLIATPRATRKFAYLVQDPRVALLIDSREHCPGDFHQAAALTAYGTAAEIKAADADGLIDLYRLKHPHLAGFLAEPSCATVLVRVSRYSLVSRFQHVLELHFQQ